MNNKTIKALMSDVQQLKEQLTKHLIESGGIRTQLTVNTLLTTLVLGSLVTKLVADYFRR